MIDPDVTHSTLGPGRRVVIPAAFCREHGLEPGRLVVIESSEIGVLLRPVEHVLREVQSYFADAAPNEVCLSDELLQDRRREAERDAHD